MFDAIKEWDTDAFLYLNSKHNSFFDVIMYWASDKFFWVPFYAILLIVVVRYFKKRSALVLIHIAALVAASDQIADLIKNTVKRLRPSHEAALQQVIHLSKAGAGGPFGFFSSHASNSFALCVFLSLLLPRSYRSLQIILLFWALLVSYSRIYNGVHYPADVCAGALSGSLLGLLFSKIYFYTEKKMVTKNF